MDRPQSPCKYPGCGALVRGAGYCDEHTKEASGWHSTTRQSRQARGYGRHWELIRERILKRDKGLCRTCLREGVARPSTHIDHVVPKVEGGTDDPANLECICEAHHRTKTARESTRSRVRGR